jgi:hypothetical protein
MKDNLPSIAVLVFVALVGIAVGALSAQSQNQRLVIKQSGVLIGTLDVPAGVTVRLGTVFSDSGQVKSHIVHLGQPADNPPVAINVAEGTTIAPER